MRKLLFLKGVVVITMVVAAVAGCTVESSRFETAIGEFVQTDKRGVWTDLEFKVLEMGEPVVITVGDSIRILGDVFEAKRKKKLDLAMESIERNRKSLEKERSPVMRKFYKKHIDNYQQMADSLSALKVSLPEGYSDENSQKVLAQEIVCKFSIIAPFVNARQELTETFVLNADGSKCYRYKSKKKY